MDSTDFGTALVAVARRFEYVRETSPNSDGGGFVDQCQAALGLSPGHSWCACAVCSWVHTACTEQNATVAFHRSARALGIWELNQAFKVDGDPQPGDLVIWDHGGGLGHIAVVTAVASMNGAVAGLSCIAGNTSADGLSRNGDRVAEHEVPYPDAKIVGYLRLTPQ